MDKRGMAFIFGLLVMVTLSILLAAFFFGSMTENNLVKRYLNSTRAFWLAEAGIAEGILNLPNFPNSTSGYVGNVNHTYSATPTHIGSVYYQIDSTGTVNLPNSGSSNRKLSAVVQLIEVYPDNFQYAIETTVDLVIHGSVDINPAGSEKEFSDINFPDMFGHSKEEIRSYANNLYTDPANNVLPVDRITWVDVSPSEEFMITSDTWSGSGLLVVAGDAQITGGTFTGIIYVIGNLRISGNPTINGSVLAESNTEVVEDTTLTGNITLNHDPAAIALALQPLQYISPQIVSWREELQ